MYSTASFTLVVCRSYLSICNVIHFECSCQGNYKVSVECDNKPVINSPWNVKAYNTSAIKVQNIPSIRTLGSPIEFTGNSGVSSLLQTFK